MTPFEVIWLSEANDELARIWTDAPDRRAVTAAEAQITKLFASNPVGNGRHLSEGL